MLIFNVVVIFCCPCTDHFPQFSLEAHGKEVFQLKSKLEAVKNALKTQQVKSEHTVSPNFKCACSCACVHASDKLGMPESSNALCDVSVRYCQVESVQKQVVIQEDIARWATEFEDLRRGTTIM